MGGRAQGAGLHPRPRSRRPPGQVRPGARGGAFQSLLSVPIVGQGRQRHRRDLQPHGGAARVHGGRGRRPRLERVARRRRDRERAPLRGDAPPRRRARAPHRARRDRSPARRRSTTVLPAVASRARSCLLRASVCHLYLLDPASEVLHLRASAPAGAGAPAPRSASPSSAPSSRAAAASASVAVPLVANDELLGLARRGGHVRGRPRPRGRQPDRGRAQEDRADRAPDREEPDQGLLRAARPAASRCPGLEGRAARLGCDLDQRHVVLAASPPVGRARARARGGGAGIPLRPPRRLDARAPPRAARRRGAAARGASASSRRRSTTPVSIGLSNVCRGAASFAAGFEEARHALLGTTVLQGDARRHDLRGARPLQVPPAHAVRRRRPRRAPRRGRRASPSTTGSARRRSCAPSRSSCAAAARSARPRRRSTSTRTRCASACAGSARSRASTCGRTTGSWSRSP